MEAAGKQQRGGFVFHSLCLFGFDEAKGNSLLASYPGSPDFASHTVQELAEICLPDGGHLREHDSTSIIMMTRAGARWYGYSCFRNIPDASSKRGARQLSLLLVSSTAHMDMWRPFLVTALDLLSFDASAARKVLESLRRVLFSGVSTDGVDSPSSVKADGRFDLNKNNRVSITSFDLWGRCIDIQPPMLLEGEFGGASLKDLVGIFRERTMHLWRAVLAESRLLYCLKGGSSFAVTSLVLATPALVGELAPLLLDVLEPYITLAVVDRLLLGSSFVAGCNNPVFAERREWWDVLADASTGSVLLAAGGSGGSEDDDDRSRLRRKAASSDVVRRRPVSGMDMAFISKVLHGMQTQGKGEAWVKSQFHDYTLGFLNRVGRRDAHMDALAAALAGLKGATVARKADKFAETFATGGLWKRYQAHRDAKWRGLGVLTETTSGINIDTVRNVDQDWGISLPANCVSHAPYAVAGANGTHKLPTGFVRETCGKAAAAQRVSVQSFPLACTVPTRPASVSSHHSSNSSQWIKVVSGDGEEYFWNVHSGQTSWVHHGIDEAGEDE